jgi:hypothetical protein
MEKGISIREELLSRHLPQPGNLADYRREVEQTLENREKRFRKMTWGNRIGGFACLATAVILMTAAGSRENTWLGISACFFLIVFVSLAMQYLISESRLELLKEAKQVQLQILELREMLQARGAQ